MILVVGHHRSHRRSLYVQMSFCKTIYSGPLNLNFSMSLEAKVFYVTKAGITRVISLKNCIHAPVFIEMYRGSNVILNVDLNFRMP